MKNGIELRKNTFSFEETTLNFLLVFFFLFFFISTELVQVKANRMNLLIVFLSPYFIFQFFLIKGIKEYSPFVIRILILYLLLTLIPVIRKGNYNIILDFFFFSFLIGAYNFYERKKNVLGFIKVINLSMVLVFLFIILIPSLPYGKFQLGGFYNLTEVPFYLTTIYPPFITGYVLVLLIYKVTGEQNTIRKSGYLFAAFFVLIYFLLINRRGPMVGFFLSILFVYYNRIFLRKYFLIILFTCITVIPFYWQPLIESFMEYYDPDFVSNFIAKADASNLLEASGRLQGWEKGLEMVSSFSLKDLWGYHETIVISLDENYNHFHNGFLQLYYEAGPVALLFNFLLFIISFQRILFLAKTKLFDSFRVKLISTILFVIFILNIAESLLDRFSLTQIMFVIIVLTIDGLYRNAKQEIAMSNLLQTKQTGGITI